jgi:hypothetical protein
MRFLKANLLINSAGAAPSAITLVSLKLRSRMFFSSSSVLPDIPLFVGVSSSL